MYVHPRPGLTRAVINAYEQTGMRGFVCRGFLSDGVEYGVPPAVIEPADAALKDAAVVIKGEEWRGGGVEGGLGHCMIWALDEASLRATRQLADELGVLVTVHVSETPFELEHSNRVYGRTDTAVLGDIGFLKPDVLAVHCVKCSSADIATLRQYGSKVSHNPCSNMYLASGLAPIPEMLKAGITDGLASDGPASSNNHSLFQAMKFAALIHKGFHQDTTIMTAEKVMEMATIDGARAVGLEKEIGSIEVGKKADLIVIDYENAFMTPIHHPVSAIVYSALGHEVSTVMIDGRFVMRDRVVTGVDELAVRRQAQSAADDLARRSGSERFKKRPWRSMTI